MRYDQFMDFGWKRLIPIALAWIVAVAVIRMISLDAGFDRRYLFAAIAVVAVLFLLMLFIGEDEDEEAEVVSDEPFDAFAGGYPVPPLPGQKPTTTRATEETDS
jgi:NADH-quinone oxidoreductase subunit H